jgi:hypothetical protein
MRVFSSSFAQVHFLSIAMPQAGFRPACGKMNLSSFLAKVFGFFRVAGDWKLPV